MSSAALTINGSVGAVSIAATLLRSAVGEISQTPTLNAAKAGTLTARTDNDTGEATLAAGHGIQTGDVVDVYWDGGLRYGMDVGVVAGQVVPLDGGAGDALPAQDTALTVARQQVIDVDFDGDKLVMALAHCDQQAHISFFEAAAIALPVGLTAREPWFWANGGTAVNPLAGTLIDRIVATTGAITAATLKIGMLYDSDA